jgi:hypothetical protein
VRKLTGVKAHLDCPNPYLGLSMGKQHMLSHALHLFTYYFAIIFFHYNNTIPHKIMPFGGVGDLL